MVDLKNLKAGDTVVHRNGGRSVVAECARWNDYALKISFEGQPSANPRQIWQLDGVFVLYETGPFDILSIEKTQPVVGFLVMTTKGPLMSCFETLDQIRRTYCSLGPDDKIIRIEHLPGSDTATATVVK
jgi:hypothetical protein